MMHTCAYAYMYKGLDVQIIDARSSEDAVLQPEEIFALYGRHVKLTDLTNSMAFVDMERLAGNCMAVQPVATVLHALLAELSANIPGLWEKV